eukprot:1155962-Pelagomonas_calceolata.AAC.3
MPLPSLVALGITSGQETHEHSRTQAAPDFTRQGDLVRSKTPHVLLGPCPLRAALGTSAVLPPSKEPPQQAFLSSAHHVRQHLSADGQRRSVGGL